MNDAGFLTKLASKGEALTRIAGLPRPVVFTNGVFDVLHCGHVTYLEKARGLGGSLVVALNTDTSAKRLGKGADRPLNNELDRAAMLAALEHRELHAEGIFTKVSNLFVAASFLGKVIRREAQYHQALVLVLGVQRLETFILRGKTAKAGGIDHHHNFACVLA